MLFTVKKMTFNCRTKWLLLEYRTKTYLNTASRHTKKLMKISTIFFTANMLFYSTKYTCSSLEINVIKSSPTKLLKKIVILFSIT